MIITVDRIEDGKIVFITEDNKQFIVDKNVFPNVKEGDIISAKIEDELISSKKAQMQNRLNNLFDR